MHSVVLAPHNGKTVVIVVFHGDAMQRMEQHDPAILEGVYIRKLRRPDSFGNEMMYLPGTDFMFCYEPDQQEFEAKCRELGDAKAVLQWLGRGWENRQDERDTLISITSIGPKEGKQ